MMDQPVSSSIMHSPVARNLLEMALRNNGYHIPCEAPDGWLGADATFAPGRCFVTYAPAGREHAITAISLTHVARALAEDGHSETRDIPLPLSACTAFIVPLDALPGAVRRNFELSRSLPSAPLDRFAEEVRAMPRTTEAERLIVQRVGRYLPRSLDGLVVGPLRRHRTRPARVTAGEPHEALVDAECLDPMNGLLLVAHWDAAFDCGLVTFADDGTPLLWHQLSFSAR